MLGLKLRREKWNSNIRYIYVNKQSVIVVWGDSISNSYPLKEFITQEHNDWVVYCPPGNEQNPEGDEDGVIKLKR